MHQYAPKLRNWQSRFEIHTLLGKNGSNDNTYKTFRIIKIFRHCGICNALQ